MLSRKAFENAIAVVMALGGSTNAVLHLLAIAHEADVMLSLDDFARTVPTSPLHCRCQALRTVRDERCRPRRRSPGGDACAAAGRPTARRRFDRHREDCGRKPRRSTPAPPDGAVLHAITSPLHASGGITVLRGSLALSSAVVKSAGLVESVFSGTAKVFDGERAALDALEEGRIQSGDAVVIRYEGPPGRARHA